MKSKKRMAFVWVLFMAMLLMCSCGKKKQNETDKIYVGVACYDQNDSYIRELIDCFEKQMESYESGGNRVIVTVRDASGSQRVQNDQVEELIDSGCNVLCINLVDRGDPSEIIDLAKNNGIPVIFFNREPVDEDMLQWDKLFYVGGDAQQSGILQGELACYAIKSDRRIDRNNDGVIQYVVLEGEPGHQDAIIRTESVVDTLESKGIKLQKLSCQIANWNRAQAQNRMLNIISMYHNNIEVVLANNDDMALGAIDAYKQLNLTESAYPLFFGVDGTSIGLEAVRDSKLAGTVYNDKEGQAEAMASLAAAAVTGDGMDKIKFTSERCIYLPYYKVTRYNIKSFLKGD